MDTIPTVMTMTGHLLMVKTVTAITLATDIQATRTATMAFLVTALMATTIMAEISRGRTKILTDQIMRIEIVSCGRISVMLMIMIMLMLGITTGTGFFFYVKYCMMHREMSVKGCVFLIITKIHYYNLASDEF